MNRIRGLVHVFGSLCELKKKCKNPKQNKIKNSAEKDGKVAFARFTPIYI